MKHTFNAIVTLILAMSVYADDAEQVELDRSEDYRKQLTRLIASHEKKVAALQKVYIRKWTILANSAERTNKPDTAKAYRKLIRDLKETAGIFEQIARPEGSYNVIMQGGIRVFTWDKSNQVSYIRERTKKRSVGKIISEDISSIAIDFKDHIVLWKAKNGGYDVIFYSPARYPNGDSLYQTWVK